MPCWVGDGSARHSRLRSGTTVRDSMQCTATFQGVHHHAWCEAMRSAEDVDSPPTYTLRKKILVELAEDSAQGVWQTHLGLAERGGSQRLVRGRQEGQRGLGLLADPTCLLPGAPHAHLQAL